MSVIFRNVEEFFFRSNS